MSGINRFFSSRATGTAKASASRVVRLGDCVFISHKREDSAMARSVADALKDMEVDIWLDLDELSAAQPQTEEEHLRLTKAIERGLNNSTHLLALITPRTKGSWWVPFEIGSCRGRSKPLAFLLHKDVSELPSYFKLGEGLKDKYSLLGWARKLSRRKEVAELQAAVELASEKRLDPYLKMVDATR